MSRDFRGLHSACTLAVFVVLSAISESQGRQASTTAHYTILTHDGSDADVEFARRWLDEAELPIGHYAVRDGRPAGGWQYYSAPQWFVQGLQEYDAIYHTTEANRTQTAAALRKWARQNEGRFACCTNGFELADVYNGGAAFMAFLAEEFGESVHERILRNGAPTFEEALTSETKPRSQSALLDRFRGRVAETN